MELKLIEKLHKADIVNKTTSHKLHSNSINKANNAQWISQDVYKGI